jgi:hypothetical protein
MRFGQYQTDSNNPVKILQYITALKKHEDVCSSSNKEIEKNKVSETICPDIENDPGKQRIT